MDAFQSGSSNRVSATGRVPQEPSALQPEQPSVKRQIPQSDSKGYCFPSVVDRLITSVDFLNRHMSSIRLSVKHLVAGEGQVFSNEEKENALVIVENLWQQLTDLSSATELQIGQIFQLTRARQNSHKEPAGIHKPQWESTEILGIKKTVAEIKEALLQLNNEYESDESCHEKQSYFIDKVREAISRLESQLACHLQAVKELEALKNRPVTSGRINQALRSAKPETAGYLRQGWNKLLSLALSGVNLFMAPWLLAEKVGTTATSLFLELLDGAFGGLRPSDERTGVSFEGDIRQQEWDVSQERQALQRVKWRPPEERVRTFMAEAERLPVTTETQIPGIRPGVDEFRRLKQHRRLLLSGQSNQAEASFERLSPERISTPLQDYDWTAGLDDHVRKARRDLPAVRQRVTGQHREAVLRSRASGRQHLAQERERTRLEELHWLFEQQEQLKSEQPGGSPESRLKHPAAAEADYLSPSASIFTTETLPVSGVGGVSNGLQATASAQERIQALMDGIQSMLSQMSEQSDLHSLEQQLEDYSDALVEIKNSLVENGEVSDDILQTFFKARDVITTARDIIKINWLSRRDQDPQQCLTEIRETMIRLRDSLQLEFRENPRLNDIEKVLGFLEIPDDTPGFWPVLNRLLNLSHSRLHRVVYRNYGTVLRQAELYCQPLRAELKRQRLNTECCTLSELRYYAESFVVRMQDAGRGDELASEYPDLVRASRGEFQALVALIGKIENSYSRMTSALAENQLSGPGIFDTSGLFQEFLDTFKDVNANSGILSLCPDYEMLPVLSECMKDWTAERPARKNTDLFGALQSIRKSDQALSSLSYRALISRINRCLGRPLDSNEFYELELLYGRILDRVSALFHAYQ